MTMVRLTRTRILWSGAALVAVLLLARLLRPAAIAVDVAPVMRGPLRVTVDEEGKTRVRDRYVVTAPAAGRVARIALREGDGVSAGQVVARLSALPLDPRNREQTAARLAALEDTRRAADASVAEARTALEQARRTQRRTEDMAAAGGVSPEEQERTRSEVTRLERQLESAEFHARAAVHEVEETRAALLVGDAGSGRSVIPLHAPIAGRVLSLPERSERVVAAGEPLVALGDPNNLEIVSELLSADAVQVQPGDTILVSDWGGEDTLRARVRTVEPAGFTKISALGVEEQRVEVIADLDDPPEALGDGYRVEVRVVLWSRSDALKIPGSALFRHGDGWAAFRLVRGRARLAPVEIGHRNAFEADVIDGLEEGSLILLHPSDRIADGVRVGPRR